MNNKQIEMEDAEFFEMTPEELTLIKRAVLVCFKALPVEEPDHDALGDLLLKLMRM